MTDLAQKLADAAVQAIATQCPVSTGDRAREVAAHAIRSALPVAQGEAVAWQLLAMKLCEYADEDPHEMQWSGGAMPEPVGEMLYRYEDEAKRILGWIAELTDSALPAAVAVPDLSRGQIMDIAWNLSAEFGPEFTEANEKFAMAVIREYRNLAFSGSNFHALYEELREIIDSGCESMTHSDAIAWCLKRSSEGWTPMAAAPASPAATGGAK